MTLDTPVAPFDRLRPSAPAAPVEVGTSHSDAPPHGRRPVAEMAGLAVLLVGTAIAYLWNLTASGYANSFYAAAVEAGTKSWKAFFFGSIDPSNFITVDKPPASLWVMELSGRLFGFSSASMLVPQALEGVATVALVYAMVRRWYGHRFAMLAGVVMATTPVAALMFRFNNPDALLVLLMTVAAYGLTRAVEKGATRWLVLAGTAIGFAFLAKMGQALLVVPGLGAAYLVAGPTPLRRRLLQLTAAGAAMVAAAGWWVLAVSLWPVADRPMIDGSSSNSIWNLIVGYNGLERVFASGGTGAGGGSNFSGATGMLRLFNSLMGGQASWLLPAAAVTVVGGLLVTARRPRQDRTRAALIMWGGWLVVTAAVFSFGQGVIHTYYTVALAPAVAVLVAVGAALVAEHWTHPGARWTAAGVVGLTAWWAYRLLDRTTSWEAWLRPAIVAAAVIAVAGLLAGPLVRGATIRRAVVGLALAGAAFATLGGPTAYALQTVGSAHSGSIPSAGPASPASGPGPASGGGTGRGPSGSGTSGPTRSAPAGSAPTGSAPTGSAPGGDGSHAAGGSTTSPSSGQLASGGTGGGGATNVSRALAKALEQNASKYRWVAATDGSQNAASLELATGGEPVMAIGGFNNQGGNLSLAQFENYVAEGDIHYYIVSGGQGGGPGGGSTSSSITSWVESHFTSRTVGGTTVYDLTSKAA